MDLSQKKCVACEGGIPPLAEETIAKYMKMIDPEWKTDGKKIMRESKFKDFADAIAFVNSVAKIAESAGHHPDIHIERWNHVRIELYTHAIGGLHENDFIVAAKIDKLLNKH